MNSELDPAFREALEAMANMHSNESGDTINDVWRLVEQIARDEQTDRRDVWQNWN